MNKIVARQLQGINAQITGAEPQLSEEQWNALEEVAAAPFELNESLYYIHKTIFAKAAKLGCEIVRRKPFESENELTALVSSLTMLEINGVRLASYKQDLDGLRECFDSNNIAGAEQWLEQHRA